MTTGFGPAEPPQSPAPWLMPSFGSVLPETWREIRLQFTNTDPENLTLAGFGDDQLAGIYRETITGLHKDALQLEGIFRLHHASRIGVLNDGLE